MTFRLAFGVAADGGFFLSRLLGVGVSKCPGGAR